MKHYGKTLILEPEDVVLYIPEILWDGYFEKIPQDKIMFQFSCIIKHEVVVQYLNFDNIILVDEELGKRFVVKGRDVNINKKDDEETSRFGLMEI